VDDLATAEKSPLQRHEGGYYVRLAARNRIGALAAIATRMAERGISLQSIVQHGHEGEPDAEVVPVVLMTYATTEATVREALAAIVADGHIAEKPQVIRIERE
jgi:homoserine dehydrogenase